MIPEGTVPSADPGPACKEFSGTIRKAIYLDAPAPPATGMPGPGAFLAMPITLLLAAMFGTFPETRWLASLMTTSPATDGPALSVEVERTG
jgi:hypothetical protein